MKALKLLVVIFCSTLVLQSGVVQAKIRYSQAKLINVSSNELTFKSSGVYYKVQRIGLERLAIYRGQKLDFGIFGLGIFGSITWQKKIIICWDCSRIKINGFNDLKYLGLTVRLKNGERRFYLPLSFVRNNIFKSSESIRVTVKFNEWLNIYPSNIICGQPEPLKIGESLLLEVDDFGLPVEKCLRSIRLENIISGHITGIHNDLKNAVKNQDIEEIRRALNGGANPDSALLFATEEGNTSLIRLALEEYQANEITNQWGQTPLLISVKNGDESWKLLLEFNASVKVVDDFGLSCVDYALKRKDLLTGLVFAERGAPAKLSKAYPLYQKFRGSKQDILILIRIYPHLKLLQTDKENALLALSVSKG